MGTIRSLFFGNFAMLAAVLCMSAPAAAIGYEPPGYLMETFSFDLDVPVVIKADVIQLAVLDQPVRSRNAHSVEYVCQNQPHTAWRIAVNAYSRIDPYIWAG